MLYDIKFVHIIISHFLPNNQKCSIQQSRPLENFESYGTKKFSECFRPFPIFSETSFKNSEISLGTQLLSAQVFARVCSTSSTFDLFNSLKDQAVLNLKSLNNTLFQYFKLKIHTRRPAISGMSCAFQFLYRRLLKR